MKKLIKAIVLLFVFVMLTGCVTSTTKVTVTKTKNVTISIYMLTDDTKNIDVSKEFDTVSLVNRGFAIEKVSQEGYSGVKISKNYKNIDDLSSLEDVNIVKITTYKAGGIASIIAYPSDVEELISLIMMKRKNKVLM